MRGAECDSPRGSLPSKKQENDILELARAPPQDRHMVSLRDLDALQKDTHRGTTSSFRFSVSEETLRMSIPYIVMSNRQSNAARKAVTSMTP
jgi:hypothetical protein